MEDRKRPGGPDDSAPPAKRQAFTVNGAKSHQDADLPFKDDIEAYQKDAILRQMREYKREKVTLESQLADMEKRSKFHDEHLRTIDAWFDQVVDDIRTLGLAALPSPKSNGSATSIPPALLFEDNETFSKHLSGRREKIISSLSDLFARYPTVPPEVAALQEQISKLLAAEKEHICELQRVIAEKEQISDRFDTATHRYMIAEKKIDRIKSAQVQKLEQQAIAKGVKEEATSGSNGAEAVNGVPSETITEEMESAKKQALAEAARRKEQLEQLETENKKLTEQVTALHVKLASLSDDDYAKTDLFKAIKSQHEDVIKRINHLEAVNNQLREEAQKYQAERTAYRVQVDDEARATLSEAEGNLVQAESNLARIRNARDELLSKVAVLEASHENVEASKQQSKELVTACEHRIKALESECDRLRLQLGEKEVEDAQSSTDFDNMSQEQLRHRISSLESQLKLLSNELPSMEAAWKKAQALAGKKVADIVAAEELVARANADKAKADQKFFAVMKAKETLEQQIRVLRSQTSKSTEIVAQLKDAEQSSRNLVEKLDKQSAETRAQMEELSIQHRALQQKLSENAIASEAQISQIAELKKLLETKDNACISAKHSQREAETERDKMAAQVEGLEKQVEYWKTKSSGNQSDDAAMMQTMLQCQVCKSNFKDTVLKTCGHVFCDTCIQDRLTNRARKCPNCGKPFGISDPMRIHF